MSTINDGGPVFPVFIAAGGASVDDVKRVVDAAGAVGLSLRDFFAAKAMQSLLTTIDEFPDEHWRTGVAMDAYAMADAMLAVRKADTQQ